MNRHFYISNNLDELETVETEMEASGISTEQIHVLSDQDADVEQHHLHDVNSFMKQDVVRSGEIGAAIGIPLAIVVLLGAYLAGWTETAVGWMPFIFLTVVILGFCIWEGGFFGIQVPNAHFRALKEKIKEGEYIFFVDVEPDQEPILDRVIKTHPQLKAAGTGVAAPHWVVAWLYRWHQFKRTI